MIARFAERRIAAIEKQIGEPVEYMRDIFRASRPAFWKFALFMPLSRHRRAASVEACAVAALVGSRSEDCGTCVQITVNIARSEGVDRDLIQAVLDRQPERLGGDLAEVYGFAESVVTAAPDAAERSGRLKEILGDEAVVDLSFVIATSRLFPTVRRGLGHAISCAQVNIKN